MRFLSISMRNFRQHKNTDLAFPAQKETDLHVIIASNGVGKTNLLRAIFWCLYGDEASAQKKDENGQIIQTESDQLPLCTLSSLTEARQFGKPSVTVTVKITAEEDNEIYVFERNAIFNSGGVFETSDFKIIKTETTGDSFIVPESDLRDTVNKFFPGKIREYFLFDAEKLQNYFDVSAPRVKDAVYEISQVNVVSKAKQHLEEMIREFEARIKKANPHNNEILKEAEGLAKDKESLENDIAALKASNAKAKANIERLTPLILGVETIAEDVERLDANQERINENESRQAELQRERCRAILDHFSLVALQPAFKQTFDYIEHKTIPDAVDNDLIEKSLAEGKCVLCHRDIDDDTTSHLLEIIQTLSVSSLATRTLLQIKNDVERANKNIPLTTAVIDEIRNSIEKIRKETTALEEANEKLRGRISACSNIEQSKLWIQEREDNQNLLTENLKKLGKYESQLEALSFEVEKIQRKKAQALSAIEHGREVVIQRDFVENAKKIVEEIEIEIIDDIRHGIESETMSLFESLIWKKGTYGRVEVTDNFNIHLFHKVTGDSCLNSCSAAETQLLALAFTIALHRVSGHNSPLFIDTPVGRVSDTNRENFARSLIDVSKNKQIIFTFTPSEFSDEVARLFNKSVLSSYVKLDLDDEANVCANVQGVM